MNHQEGTFTGHDGTELYYQSWRPEGAMRATLIIVHGLGEHSGRYYNVVEHLVPKGVAIYAHDHRGHGRSPGQRGFIRDWSLFVEDMGAFVQFVQAFMLGHSMGGNIMLNYVLRHPQGLNGVIASAPAVGRLDIPPVLAFLSRLLSRVWPTLSLDTGLDATAISRDETAVRAYQNDPLVHSQGTPRFGVELARSAEWVMAHAADLEPPLLLLHGDADGLVNVENSRQFFDRVTLPDKTIKIYEGGYHESHNDIHKAQMLADLEQWLEAHLSHTRAEN